MAKDAFKKRKELVTNCFNIPLKKKIVKTLVWSVALYGQTHGHFVNMKEEGLMHWTCGIVDMKKDEENCLDRPKNKCGCARDAENKTSNSDNNSVVRRKNNWIGPVLRGESWSRDVIDCRMEGKNTRWKKNVYCRNVG